MNNYNVKWSGLHSVSVGRYIEKYSVLKRFTL